LIVYRGLTVLRPVITDNDDDDDYNSSDNGITVGSAG